MSRSSRTCTSEIAGLQIEKASMADIPGLLTLINAWASRGVMLPRTEFEMAENLRDFSVLRADGRLAGCAALHFYTPLTAEIRSLAIAEELQGRGGGKRLVEALEQEAQAFGLESVFAFTYIPEFFRKLEFVEIGRDELPLKAWKDCLKCPKFQCCDEIAVIKGMRNPHMGVGTTRICGASTFDPERPRSSLLPPVLPHPR
jgi:amino-acid N-acetyltransferase